MKTFYLSIKDAVRYALSDWKVVLVIGGLMCLSSISNKISVISLFKISNIFMVFVIGYGSFIAFYTIHGDDVPLNISNVKRIFWEGFKKSVILMFYSLFLNFFFTVAKSGYDKGDILIAVVSGLIFALIWLVLIGGLINRYLNKGKFTKAFDIVEIVKLLKSLIGHNFIRLIVAVIIAQVFALSVFIGLQDGLSVLEIVHSILTFFLAPFLFIATKRLVGLNIRELVK